MALILNTHYKYDTEERYYYLTPTGAELLTGLDELSTLWKNAERRLKSHGQQLKSVMCYSRNDSAATRFSRKDFVEYKQYANPNGELQDVLYMLGQWAEWAYDIDGDRIFYEERNPFDAINLLPFTIQERGRRNYMIYDGYTDFEVPIAVYQVGY